MQLNLNAYNAVCETKVFEINGIKASYKDFGEKFDAAPDVRKPHACCNMKFQPRKPVQQVLDKYAIDVDEYSYICKQLQNTLSFGQCRLCV
jgi:hypothetical protein